MPLSFAYASQLNTGDDSLINHRVNPKQQAIKLYWKDDKHQNSRSIQNLKLWLGAHKRKLVFAMNAGIYKQGNSPLGLFIENQKTPKRVKQRYR